IDPQTQQPVLTFDAPRTEAELADIREWALQLPSSLVKQGARPLAIAFDELQEIRAFDGPRLEQMLRAAFQTHSDVGSLFGRHQPPRGVPCALAPLSPHPGWGLAKEVCPFYRSGHRVARGSVAEEHWMPSRPTRLRRGSVKTTADVVRLIVSRAEGIPYYVMR